MVDETRHIDMYTR